MNYEQPLFRPPSEAYSLILQVTSGCSHNRCTFCGMYKKKKYRVKPLEEVRADIARARARYGMVRRVFLADGDALAMETEQLLAVTAAVKEAFPGVERISVYGGPGNILEKSEAELSEIRAAGVPLIYFGIESGDETVLRETDKGVTAAEMVTAGQKARAAGFQLSATVILGLGGQRRWREHALGTAALASLINPEYLAALTLMVHPGTALARQIESGGFQLPSPRESLAELKLLIESLQVKDSVFRSNHASNYYPVGGVLPRERGKMLAALEAALADPRSLKQESFRGF